LIILLLLHNIRQRRHVEEELIAGEERLKDAQRISHLGSWEWNIEDNSEKWSDEQFLIFGYEPGEIAPTYDHFVEALHPEDRNNVLAAVKNTLDGMKPYNIEFRIIRPDKSERIILAQGEVIRDEGNKPVRMLGTVLDVTERKEIEKSLLKSHERYEAFIENSTEAIFCVGLDVPMDINIPEDEQIAHIYKYAYIAEANDIWARNIIGFEDVKSLIGARLEEIMPQSIPENIAFLKEMIRARYRLDDYETVEVYKTGVKIIASNTISGVINNGHLVRIWGTKRDITKQKQIETELKNKERDLQNLAGHLISSQEKELSRLARELHDDLTQHLAVVAIEAGAIEQEFKDLPETVRHRIGGIKNQLIKMSKEVHVISRDLHPSILDDLGLVRAIQTECNSFSSRTGIAIIFNHKHVPDGVSKEIALSVYRIVQEGLSNILKHANTKSAYVFLESSDHNLLLSVRDTGVGFDHKQVRQQASLGLGSIRERARLVNGKSSITSSPGKGTNIEVNIPL
jgi:PAS domain S-box-containing protein